MSHGGTSNPHLGRLALRGNWDAPAALTGTHTLTKKSGHYQRLDPGAAPRDVVLYPETRQDEGDWFEIGNAAGGAPGELRRSHEVAEHDGELPALGLGGLPGRRGFSRGSGGRPRLGLGGTDPQQDLALTSRDLLNVHKLFDQGLEPGVVEIKLELERAERDAVLLL